MRLLTRICASIALALVFTGCGDNTGDIPTPDKPPGKVPTASTNAAVESDRQVFSVKGVVEKVNEDQKSARIKHEEIPNYMQAMTMEFAVKDTNQLSGLQPGDTISFQMVVLEDDAWIEDVKKLNTTPGAAPKPMVRVTRDVEELEIGDTVPEYTFTNEQGKTTSLSQFKGQAVALTFIFTTCPYPTFCPRLSQHFAATQKTLKETANAPTNWHLLSLTIDPDIDKPEVLKRYGKGYNQDPEKWNFLTGDITTITEIADQLGLMFGRPEGVLSHNLRTAVIDSQGRLQKLYVNNDWTPEELAEELIKAAGSGS